MSKCTAITRGGGRCKGTAIDGSGLCHAHHPDRAEQRKRAARRGGKRGGRGRPQQELADIKARLSELAEQVLADEVNRSNAAVAGQILNTVIRAVSVELKAREQLDLFERVEELERLLEHEDNGGGYGAAR